MGRECKEENALKHVFIINPSAGKNDSRQRIYTMAEALREKHGLDVQCMLTASVGHAAALARGLAESGEEVRLYACGGDGTVNEVANGIAGYANAAMTCIPIGTGNDFLKNFGADYEKFLDAENLWNGEDAGARPHRLQRALLPDDRLLGHRRAHCRERA